MSLPSMYQWILKEPGPKMLLEGVKLFGIHEVVGPQHNPIILDWAKQIGIGGLVKDDEQAWCGLFIAYIATRAQKYIPMKEWDILRALEWKRFGNPVDIPMLGDVLIFKRDGGGHVALYVGEDNTHYHVLGGNQSNQVSITRIAKERLYAARRPAYINQPTNVRRVFLSPTGEISQNEA